MDYKLNKVGPVIDELLDKIENLREFDIVLAATLPEASAQTEKKLFLIPSANPMPDNAWDEYVTIHVNDEYRWERVGGVDAGGRVYEYLTKVVRGFYKIVYDDIDYEYAKEYLENYTPNSGGCSLLTIGQKVGRNYDWKDDDAASFFVRTPSARGRYKVMGMAAMPAITSEFVESREYSDAYRVLPFFLLDGLNEKKLFMEVNVVPAKGNTQTTPLVEKRDRISTTMLIRYVLDNFDSVDNAVDYLRNYVEIYMSPTLRELDYEPHFVLKDMTKTVVMEFVDNEIVTVETNISTNYHLNGVTFNEDGGVYTPKDSPEHLPSYQGIEDYGTGLERWNILNAATDLEQAMSAVFYSKAYTDEDIWFSEFVGGAITVDTPATNPDFIARVEEYREAYERHEGVFWKTIHSCIYDLEKETVRVLIRENETGYDFSFSGGISIDLSEYAKLTDLAVVEGKIALREIVESGVPDIPHSVVIWTDDQIWVNAEKWKTT